MDAMTMDFPVKEQSDFNALKPGEKIRATVFVQGLQFWVGEVKKDEPPPSK